MRRICIFMPFCPEMPLNVNLEISNAVYKATDLEALPERGLEAAAHISVLHFIPRPLAADNSILQQLACKGQVVEGQLCQPIADRILLGH